MKDQTIISIVGMVLLAFLAGFACFFNLNHGTVAGALAIIGTIVGYSFGLSSGEKEKRP